jgi:hypothetical protein
LQSQVAVDWHFSIVTGAFIPFLAAFSHNTAPAHGVRKPILATFTRFTRHSF